MGGFPSHWLGACLLTDGGVAGTGGELGKCPAAAADIGGGRHQAAAGLGRRKRGLAQPGCVCMPAMAAVTWCGEK